AVLQVLDVLGFQGEAFEIGELGRIAEFLKGQIAWKLAQRVDVRCEVQILVRRRFYIYRAENKDLIGRARLQNLRERLTAADCSGLIIIQPDVLSKKFKGLRILRLCGCSSGKNQEAGEHPEYNPCS